MVVDADIQKVVVVEEIKNLNDVETLLKKGDFESANSKLKQILDGNLSEELHSRANYLMGYIHTKSDYENKNKYTAKNSLIACIESKHPFPKAFCWYADLEKDNNVSINYLKDGLKKFPDNCDIYTSLLEKISSIDEKFKLITKIKKMKLLNYDLLLKVIKIFIFNEKWEDCEFFSRKMLLQADLTNREILFFKLLLSYSLIFKETKASIKEAEKVLLDLIESDKKNQLGYAHYMGLIWVNIKQSSVNQALKYFDKIPTYGLEPITSSGFIFDLEVIYNQIFQDLSEFIDDKIRIQKMDVLKVMYLYSFERDYDEIDKTKKKDIKVLEGYFKNNDDNIDVGNAILFIKDKFKLKFDAYKTYIELFDKKDSFHEFGFILSDILYDITNEDLYNIYSELLDRLKKDYINDKYISEIFDPIIKCIFKSNIDDKYQKIVDLADSLKDNELKKSKELFKIAYSYGSDININKAEKIYTWNLKRNPDCNSTINNLGVIYEEQNEYEKALDSFQRAKLLNLDEEKYERNFKRVQDKIKEIKNLEFKEISNNLNIKFLEDIGYNGNLVNALNKVNDDKLRELLVKDLKECAICIATGQNKSAMILCGSIVEAILVDRIIGQGIKKYEVGKKKNNKNVKDMGLDELLEIAKNESIISSTTCNLSYYIKDYRNIIHPSYTLRKKVEISDEDVMMTWNVLKKIIKNVLV